MGLSRRAYAEHRKQRGLTGTTESAVRKALATGRIRLEADGTIDPVKADRLWEAGTDKAQQRSQEALQKGVEAAQRTAAEGEQKPVPPEARRAVEETISSSDGMTLAKATAAHKAIQAQHAKLRLDKLRGRLVDRQKATAHVFELARKERDSWLQLPARVAAIMAADLGVDAHAMEQALDAMISNHLAKLAEIRVEFPTDDDV